MFRSEMGKRSDAQKREDAEFMQALHQIKTLRAKNGHLSMDASDLQEQVEKLHEAGLRLVHKRH